MINDELTPRQRKALQRRARLKVGLVVAGGVALLALLTGYAIVHGARPLECNLFAAACGGPGITLAEIRALDAGMTPSTVAARLGAPARTMNGGLIVDVYTLKDGTSVMLSYGSQREGLKIIRWVRQDGTYEDILSLVE